MRKKLVMIAACAALGMALSACGAKEAPDTVSVEETEEGMAQETEKETGGVQATPATPLREREALPESTEMGTCTLIDYQSVVIEQERPEAPTSDEIDDRISLNLAEDAREVEGRGIQNGDLVTASWTSTIGGVEQDSGEEKFVYGEDEDIRSEFADAIAGAVVGEEREATVVIPEGTGSSELSGNTVVFHITVESVKEAAILDEEYLAKAGVETVEEYRDQIKDTLAEEAETRIRFQSAYQLLEQIITESEFNFSEQFLAELYADYDVSFEEWLENNAMTREEYLESARMTEEGLSAEREETVMENARLLMTAKNIQEGQELAMDNDTVRAYWKSAYGYELTDEEIEETFQGQDLAQIRAMAALINYLADSVRIQYVDVLQTEM